MFKVQTQDFNTIFQEEKRKKEGNVLFNDTLNTFYLWFYGKGPLG